MSDRLPTKAHDASPAPRPAPRCRLVGLSAERARRGWPRTGAVDGDDAAEAGGEPLERGRSGLCPCRAIPGFESRSTAARAPSAASPRHNLPVLFDRAPAGPDPRWNPRCPSARPRRGREPSSAHLRARREACRADGHMHSSARDPAELANAPRAARQGFEICAKISPHSPFAPCQRQKSLSDFLDKGAV